MRTKTIISLLLILAAIAANAYISINGFNGTQIGELAEKYKTLASPAAYAFSIWSVIYIGLTSFGIWQLFKTEDELSASIQPWLWLNLVANVAWLTMFHSQMLALSLVVMLVVLVSLLIILTQLYKQENTPNWVQWVFEIYTGWISVATLVNAALVVKYEFGYQPTMQTQMIILFGLLMVVSLISSWLHAAKGKVAAYALVLIWAFFAIHQKQKMEGIEFTFFPLLPLLIVVPDFVLNLVKTLNQANHNN